MRKSLSTYAAIAATCLSLSTAYSTDIEAVKYTPRTQGHNLITTALVGLGLISLPNITEATKINCINAHESTNSINCIDCYVNGTLVRNPSPNERIITLFYTGGIYRMGYSVSDIQICDLNFSIGHMFAQGTTTKDYICGDINDFKPISVGFRTKPDELTHSNIGGQPISYMTDGIYRDISPDVREAFKNYKNNGTCPPPRTYAPTPKPTHEPTYAPITSKPTTPRPTTSTPTSPTTPRPTNPTSKPTFKYRGGTSFPGSDTTTRPF